MKKGMLIVNTGDGKGKSTAAFGMVVEVVEAVVLFVFVAVSLVSICLSKRRFGLHLDKLDAALDHRV